MSSCIAITLAVKRRDLELYALDSSESALEVAQDNAFRHEVDDRIEFQHGDLGTPPEDWPQQMDAVVSNPPYVSAEDWQAVIDTNLTGVYNVSKAAMESLSDGGRIINLASVSAVVGFFGQSNYAAAKAGVMGLTRVLSRELAKRRITVNAVAPGVVLTEMGETIPEQTRADMLKSIPLGRCGEPEEIAGVILFLCSELASYVTGQVIHVNGGWWG